MLMDVPRDGDHVLVHNQLAFRLVDEGGAAQIRNVLIAVLAAQNGEPYEHLLGDLIEGGAAHPALSIER